LPLVSELWPIFPFKPFNSQNKRSGDQPKDNYIFALTEMVIFSFLGNFLPPLIQNNIQVRNTILMLSNLKHSITIMKSNGISNSKWDQLAKQVENVRAQWFVLSEEEIKAIILNLISTGIEVQLEIIQELRGFIAKHIDYSGDNRRSPNEVVGVIDQSIYFISDWSPIYCLELIDDVFRKTGQIIRPMPLEFALLIVSYSNEGGLTSKYLAERFIHNLIPKEIRSSSTLQKRCRLIESILQSVWSLGMRKAFLPVSVFDLDSTYKKSWQDLAMMKSVLGKGTDSIVSFYYNTVHVDRNIRNLVDERHFEEALVQLDNLLRQFPEHAEGHYLFAFCLHNLKRDLDKALVHYNLALENNFDEFWVRYNRGFLQMDLGNTNEACADLKRVLELNPEYPGLKQKLTELCKE
jgi:hypothetical protein